MQKWSRRDVLRTSAAAIGSTVFAQPLRAALPEAEPTTPALIEAARKEGKIAFYSALELNISEKLARAFEAKYPGIAARVERSGAERIFQRIGQEQDSRINAVDLVCTTDPAHFIFWKRKDWIAPYVTEDMAKNLPRDQINPDGTSATVCAWFSVIGYNTELVKPEDAPKSYADLLDPKWKGKIVKAHPGYSAVRS
jgi:iron(III) transport system substrate-binding protein